ncbi:ABC transporter ATP-binding protein [Acuticoccus sediminis]|uniref:ABC transporter ATP-binding protein n=1 Tax=Acuticoccus sediminis TaxID=2184697 RepID=A0A8B2NKM4_9HYPH|nr:ABC transporter ATP-binding protein [Acuticoccus sediminis]RAI00165.1 ABC transporter ATP-binding protein [Acuticoccus sediminis]
MSLLSVTDLSLGFAGDRSFAHVLDGVNLSIGPGQIMGVVGESGCGKTTLARAILGVLPAHSTRIRGGGISFRGVDMLSPGASADLRGRAVTFVPQDPFSSLNPLFRIGDQIMDLMKFKSPRRKAGPVRFPLFAPYPRRRRKADRARLMEVLEQVQLPQPDRLLKKFPHEVSGGQRQRLMIAMALLPEPDLIIADEPTTALDVTIQAQILGLLRRLANDNGVAVMLTTHDLGSAYEICDAITVMYAGQDVEAAPIDEFFARPAHPYTNALLASLPSEDGSVSGIPGTVPSLTDAPAGCRFHPRCERATAECRTVRPGVTGDPDRHGVRCYHPVQPLGAAA